MKSFFENKYVNWVWLIALLLCPFVLWLLPSDFFDNSSLALCPSKLFFSIECFGCGITRAVMHFHHFEFADAAYFNKLVFAVYPLLIYIWVDWVKGTANNLGINPLKTNKAVSS